MQAGGGDQDRHTDGRAEHRSAKVRAGHAPEHAREEAEPLEGGALLQQRHLVAEAAGVVGSGAGGEAFARQALVVVYVDRLHALVRPLLPGSIQETVAAVPFLQRFLGILGEE